MFRKIMLFIIVLATLLAACGSVPAIKPAGGKLNVVVSFSILGDIVQNVGGDKVEVRILVGPNGDAHTFEPSPADGVALAGATVVFENGLEFEPWLDDLYA